HAAGEHGAGHAVDLAVDAERGERRVTERGLHVVGDQVGQVLHLPGLDDVGELAATAGHEDVGHVAGVDGGLQLAVHVLVLDGGDLDGHLRVLLGERRCRVVPVLLARSGGRVVPQDERGVAIGGGAAVVARGAAGQGEHPDRGHGRRGGQSLSDLHAVCLLIFEYQQDRSYLLPPAPNVLPGYSDTHRTSLSIDIDNVFDIRVDNVIAC